MEDDKNEKDRQLIEDYLKEYNIESILDEVINNIIERRPQNPYVELSKLLETKTKPEIIEVNITSIICGCSSFGIRATVLTNVGTFIGETALPFISNTTIPLMKDYTAEQVKIEDAIKHLNPLSFPAIDEALFQLQGVDNYILFAVSIACIRGASKFRGLSLYQYISELAGTEPQIPLPVCTLLSRCVGDPVEKQIQNIHLYPIQSTSFSNAVEILLQGVDRVHKDLFTPVATIQIVETPHAPPPATGKKGAAAAAAAAPPQPQQITIPPQPAVPLTIPINGSLCVLKQTLDSTLKAAYTSLKNEPSMLARLKLSVDYKAQTLYKMSVPKNSKGEPIPNAEEELVYAFNGLTEPSTSGSDTIDMIINQLKEYHLISFEDPLNSKDITSLRLLKERIAQTIETWRDDSNHQSDHSYSLHGIGGDEGCNVQIIADQAYTQSEEIRQYANEAVYNAINIHFDKIFSIMKAIELCKTAHEIGWSVIISTSKYTPETIELFLSDFAVGIGSSQFIIGGIHSIEYSMKFNRIFDILNENDLIHFAGNNFRK